MIPLAEKVGLVVPENSMKWVVRLVTIGIMVYGVWFALSQSSSQQEAPVNEIITTNNQNPAPSDKEADVADDPNARFTSAVFATIADTVRYQHVEETPTAPFITNDAAVDAYLQQKAEARGYQLRYQANESRLIALQGKRLQPEAAERLQALQAAAKKEGMNITFVSGYRSIADQRRIVVNKLGTFNREDLLAGKLDAQIESILVVSSLPGYSKHHTGYTVDLACGNTDLSNAFMQTKCYEWLSQDNFKNARAYNFIPSYPVGVERQGPDPESWEFVWVPDSYLE